MWRVSKIQRESSIFLQEIDNYLFDDAIEVVNNEINFSIEMQELFITENFTRFSDITTNIKDLLKLEDITVILIDSITKEEIEVMIKIEGGI